MPVKPLAVTDDTFEAEVIKSDLPVLVDFWAEWCAPCLMIAPTLEELAEDYDGKAKICKVDVDRNRDSAGRFGVRSIPTLLIFKDGEVRDQQIGVVPKEQLVAKLDAVLRQ